MTRVENVIREFATKLMAVVREEVVEGVDAMFESDYPSVVGKTGIAASNGKPTIHPINPRAKTKANGAPIQLCPVPGCKERAAPSLGMVCMKHKSVPKAQIAKYREARRKAKVKAS